MKRHIVCGWIAYIIVILIVGHTLGNDRFSDLLRAEGWFTTVLQVGLGYIAGKSVKETLRPEESA